MEYNNAVSIQHLVWDEVLTRAEVIVDATCGNGKDTLYMARKAKKNAIIHAIDIQEKAILQAQDRVKEYDVQFHRGSHEVVMERLDGPFDLVVFNLGYLPGGNHSLMTSSKTTIQAIVTAFKKLSIQGMITVVAYPGTVPGKEEQESLEHFLSAMCQQEAHCWRVGPMNQRQDPPVLYVIQKRK